MSRDTKILGSRQYTIRVSKDRATQLDSILRHQGVKPAEFLSWVIEQFPHRFDEWVIQVELEQRQKQARGDEGVVLPWRKE